MKFWNSPIVTTFAWPILRDTDLYFCIHRILTILYFRPRIISCHNFLQDNIIISIVIVSDSDNGVISWFLAENCHPNIAFIKIIIAHKLAPHSYLTIFVPSIISTSDHRMKHVLFQLFSYLVTNFIYCLVCYYSSNLSH